MGAMGAFPLVLTLYLQEGLGYSAIHAASISSASAIGMAISAYVAGRLLPRFRGKVLVTALIVFTTGDLALTAVVWRLAGTASGGSVGLLLLVPLAVSGLGLGGVSTPNQALSYTGIDTAHASTAGGMLQTANRISIAIDSAIATAVFYTVALNGGPVTGRAHQQRYGHAYAAALIFILALALGSLAIAIRTDRRDRRPVPAVL
jgi:fucose 4-O-acetylase-like acetyltransferase